MAVCPAYCWGGVALPLATKCLAMGSFSEVLPCFSTSTQSPIQTANILLPHVFLKCSLPLHLDSCYSLCSCCAFGRKSACCCLRALQHDDEGLMALQQPNRQRIPLTTGTLPPVTKGRQQAVPLTAGHSAVVMLWCNHSKVLIWFLSLYPPPQVSWLGRAVWLCWHCAEGSSQGDSAEGRALQPVKVLLF